MVDLGIWVTMDVALGKQSVGAYIILGSRSAIHG
jgi:hypothetical protein